MENQNSNVLNWEETYAKLAAPFKTEEIEWRLGATFTSNNALKGIAMPYVTNRAIQKRLDETFGIFGWKNEYKEWLKGSQLCGISVRVVYEDGNSEWITKWDGAECSDVESIKGGLSDSMKRAAFQWSIARYIYEIETQYVEVEQKGKSKVIVKKEFARLKAYLNGNKYTPTLSEDKNTSQNAQQNTENYNSNANGNSNETKNNQKAAVETSGNTSQNSNNKPATNTKTNTNSKGGVSAGKASPKQVGFIKSLLQKSNNSIDTILTKYEVADLEGLNVGQVQEVIKSLMAIAS